MAKDFMPAKIAELVPWLANFSSKLTATPTIYGANAGQASTLAGLVSAFNDAQAVVAVPTTRTRSAIAGRDDSMRAVKEYVRELARVINAFPEITNELRLELGLNPRKDEATPSNAPTEYPVLEVLEAIGRLLRCRVHGQDTTRRGKPEGCSSATIFSYVGSAPPSDMSLYKFEGTSTTTHFEIEFAPTVPAGAQVWLTAFWNSPRCQSGPACQPITAYLAGGVVGTPQSA